MLNNIQPKQQIRTLHYIIYSSLIIIIIMISVSLSLSLSHRVPPPFPQLTISFSLHRHTCKQLVWISTLYIVGGIKFSDSIKLWFPLWEKIHKSGIYKICHSSPSSKMLLFLLLLLQEQRIFKARCVLFILKFVGVMGFLNFSLKNFWYCEPYCIL